MVLENNNCKKFWIYWLPSTRACSWRRIYGKRPNQSQISNSP